MDTGKFFPIRLGILRLVVFSTVLLFLWRGRDEKSEIGLYPLIVGGFVLLSIGHAFSSIYPWVSMQHALNIAMAAIILGWAYRIVRIDPDRARDWVFLPICAVSVLQFVMAFRAEYTLQPSVFSMMEKVMDRTAGPLRSLMKVTSQTFFLTSSPQRAFEELRRRTDNVYLNQFAYVLEMAENAAPEAVIKALQGLEFRLRSHSELRQEVQSNLASIGTQTMIMQVVASAILLAVALVPMLRQAYTTSFGQFVYVGVLTVMLASSYYIDHETQKLGERIS